MPAKRVLHLHLEREWFDDGRPRQQEMLERGDFSAATDLYQNCDGFVPE